MSYSSSDSVEPISIIEEIDPEPVSGNRPRLDAWLGVPLLLGIILFVGWQWWRQDYQAGQYRAGQEAMGRNELEAALHYFSEASGYNNAEALAKSTQEQIAERDRLYSLVVSYSNQEDWLLALKSIREAAKIEPDYRDLSQREQIVLDNVYDSVLSGTVALRTGANPQGLYYRSAGGWTYLRGSDSYSALRTNLLDGRFVYDAAERGWTPPLEPNRGNFPNRNLRGRYLMYAHYAEGGQIEYKRMALDPSYYTRLIAGSNGIWGIHYKGDAYPDVQSIVRSPFINTEMAYQPYSIAPTSTVGYAPMPRGKDIESAVMDISQGSNRYLVATWSKLDPLDAPGDVEIDIDLYLAVAGKGPAQLIYTHHSGGLISAQLSPDERYVMVHTYSLLDVSYTERQSIRLIDLQDATYNLTPFLVLDMMAPIGDSNRRPSSLGSVFVPDGPFAGDIVLSHFTGDHTWLQVLDPASLTPSNPRLRLVADARVDDTGLKEWVIDAGDQSRLLIIGHDYRFEGVPPTNTLSIVTVTPGSAAGVHEFVVPSSSYLQAIKSAPFGLVWSSYQWQTEEYRTDMAAPASANIVYSAPGPQLGVDAISPVLAYRQTFNRPVGNRGGEPKIVLGERFFAYSYDGKLHLRNYDGAEDLILESGTQSIDGENRYGDYWTYLRR